MKIASRLIGLVAVLLLSLFALGANAQRTDEPTLAQIYQAANSGELQKAQGMIDEVLQAHPNSGKAHYVKAELAARDNNFSLAREELATAEKLSPGLAFAKPESVQALRNQIAPRSSLTGGNGFARQASPVLNGAAADRASPSFPWGTVLLIAAVAAVVVALLRAKAAPRARDSYGPAPYGQPGPRPMYPPPDSGGAGAAMPPGSAGYGQPSMGGSIMRGLGTGLAIGAGAVAAQEIGRRMFSHEGQQVLDDRLASGNAQANIDAIDEGMRRNLNSDMGGDDFGIADDGWDDAGGDMGGGGWDS